MDAVKFFQKRNRMYKSGAVTPGYDYDPVSAVKVVEEWAAAHPSPPPLGQVYTLERPISRNRRYILQLRRVQ